MNRQIKFRAFSDKSGMWSWEKLTTHAGGHPLSSLYSHDGWQVMQFTGLRDKNGVDIYEGDIVRYWPTDRPDQTEVYKVKFNTARFLLVKSVLDVREMFVCGKYDQCEVIGNIHENPELLENK